MIVSSGSRRQSVAERIRGQRDDELYPSLTSKLHCMLEQGAIITYTKDRSIADEIALERVALRRGDAVEEIYDECA